MMKKSKIVTVSLAVSQRGNDKCRHLTFVHRNDGSCRYYSKTSMKRVQHLQSLLLKRSLNEQKTN